EYALTESPRARSLERELEIARSRHRSESGIHETTTGLQANVEGRHEGASEGRGLGAGVVWTVRKPMGRTELEFAVGPGIARRWRSEQVEAAPLVRLNVVHPFGLGPDVRRERTDHELAKAEQRHRSGRDQ